MKQATGEDKTGGPGMVTGFADGLPAIAGDWSGSHEWKGYGQYDPGPGEKDKGHGKDPIDLAVAQKDESIDVTYTVFGDDGPGVLSLAGEHGNGHFWAFGHHPVGGGRVLLIGHLKKTKIKGVGIAVLEQGVFDTKFKAKSAK